MRYHSNRVVIGVDKNQLTGTHGASNRMKHKQMMDEGAELLPLRIPFGDYILITDEVQEVIDNLGGADGVHKKDLLEVVKVSIDTKKNLEELCQNVCQGHERFKRELSKPLEQGAKLIILVEDGEIESLEDVYFWQNPRLKKNPKATKGESLYKSLCTIRDRYNVRFVFCSRRETGKKILEILKGGAKDGA